MRTAHNKIHFTPEMDAFLKSNFDTMTNRELADHLGLRLTSTRTRCYRLGLKKMEMEYWTEKQVQFLLDNYKEMGDTEIAEIFDSEYHKEKGWSKKHVEKKRRYLKLKRTEEEKRAIHARNTKNGRFSVNHWKRWDGLAAEVGTVKVWRNDHGPVKYIKTSHGYMKLSNYNWIKAHGSIPKGFNIVHKDRDALNCDIDNLECISNSENMMRNSGSKNLSDTYVAGILTHGDKETRAELLKNPELIDLKRNSLILNRKINEKLRQTK